MTTYSPRIVHLDETPPNRRRGGDLRAMLTPTAVGATSGFMGMAIIHPGERIGEHYHPYSEEFVYVVRGDLEVDLDGVSHPLRPDQALMIPPFVRHRFRNVGAVEARMVFHLGPLAPTPPQGHVDTEDTPEHDNARRETPPGTPWRRSPQPGGARRADDTARPGSTAPTGAIP